MRKLLPAILMIFFGHFMSTPIFANSDVNKFPLEKTGTTCELINISFSSAVDMDGKEGVRTVEKKIPEFHMKSSDMNAKRITSGQLEVRFASEFTVSKEEAKAFGSTYFSEAMQDMVSLAAKREFVISPDLDDSDFQFFVKSQAPETSDPEVIQLIKFIDIYENYEYNLKMKELAATLENTVFSSITDFVTDQSLNELLSMMPIAGVSTAETAESTNDNLRAGGTGIDGRNGNNFAGLVSQYLLSVGAFAHRIPGVVQGISVAIGGCGLE